MIPRRLMHLLRAAVLAAACFGPVGGLTAQVTSDWTCLSGANDWSLTSCWSGLAGGDAYPDNGTTTYAVTLPNGNYTVNFNAGTDTAITIDSLSMPGTETRFEVGSGRSFIVLGSLMTRGTLTSKGTFSTGAGASIDVDATHLTAAGGGTLTLPVTSFTDASGYYANQFRAGTGSVLDLPALETMTGNTLLQ